MLVIQSNTKTGNTGLPILKRDPLLTGDNGGVRFAFDLAFPFSYPLQAAPVGGTPVKDISEHADGSFVSAGGVPTFAGGGFDFSSLPVSTSGGTLGHVAAPASVAADIYSKPNQFFLVAAYLRLPAAGDYINLTSGIFPFITFMSQTNGYASEADLVTIAAVGNSGGTIPALTARRQQAGAGSPVDQVTFNVPTAALGQFAQIAYSRTASGQTLSLRTAASGITSGSAAVGSNNTGDFSGKTAKFGVSLPYTASMTAGDLKYRLYRGFIENLVTSGRDPAAVLDADWKNTIARGAFS